MRIDGPKGLGSWLHGFFEGKFRGELEGTASYALTASYAENVGEMQDYVSGSITGMTEDLEKAVVKLDAVSGSVLETQRDLRDLSGSLGRTQENVNQLSSSVLSLSQSVSASAADIGDAKRGTFEQMILSGSVPLSPRLTVYGGVKVIGSLAQGREDVRAGGEWSHAEGAGTEALGAASHAEGNRTKALGVGSHAEGSGSRAIGVNSHAGGLGTIAAGDYQTVFGRYNVPDASEDYVFIIGNGTSEENRSNVFAVKWSGDVEWDGDIIIRKKVALRWNGVRESLDIDFL